MTLIVGGLLIAGWAFIAHEVMGDGPASLR